MKTESNVKVSSNVERFTSSGLLGFYFKGNKFNDLLLITQNKTGQLSLEKNQIANVANLEKTKVQSARWFGFIKPEATADYVFSAPSNEDMLIQIDNKIIVMGRKITLERGKLYEVRIESKFEDNVVPNVDCELSWSYLGKKEVVSSNCLLVPNLKNIEFHPKTSLFGDVSDATTDTDNDGIPDDWEINGYTYIAPNIVVWNDEYEGTYTKYVSNPYQAHTAGDPYTDFEKVSGLTDKALTPEAWNPLVAAYPVVGVGMEKLILSSTEDFTTTENHTTSTSTTKSNSEGAEFNGGGNKDKEKGWGFFGGITGNFSHTTSTTNTTEDSSGTETHINEGDSAHLNANVRYYNTGSAPIYQVTPTTNFVLDTGTINTITVPPSNIGNSLTPGSTYPVPSQNAIALNTIDGSTDIKVSLDQLTEIQNGDDLILETTQTTGLYGSYQNGEFVTPDTNKWDPYFVQIQAATASIILDTGDEVLERAVAAKNYTNPNDYTPELTIGDAICIAFGATKTNDLLYYKDIPIYESSVELIYDTDTATDIQNQLDSSDSTSVYGMQIKVGMNIMIKVPEIFDDASETTNNSAFSWQNVQVETSGKEGGGYSTTGTSYGTWKFNIEQNTRYILSMYVKTSDNSEHQIKLGAGNGNISTYTITQEYTVSNEWQRIELEFNPYINTNNFKGIALQSIDGSQIHFDDISITKLNLQITEESIKEAHSFVSWDPDVSTHLAKNYLYGVYFTVNPYIVCDYQLVISDKNYGSRPSYDPDENNKIQINFTDYGDIIGSCVFESTQVYALYKDLDPVLVAEWIPMIGVSLCLNSDGSGGSMSIYINQISNLEFGYDMKDNDNFNDISSSINVAPHVKVVLYSDFGFSGSSTTLENDSDQDKLYNLQDCGFNDKLSSLKIYNLSSN